MERFIADGAYDGAPTRDLLVTRLGEIVEAIIPPPKTAVQSPQSTEDPSIRDRHIVEIETKGRMAWHKSTGYTKRSRVGTQMGRWKAIIGPKLKARNFGNQRTGNQTAKAEILPDLAIDDKVEMQHKLFVAYQDTTTCEAQ